MHQGLTVDDLLQRALAASSEGEFVVAEELFRAVIEQDPVDVRARQYLAGQLVALQRPQEAVELLEVATALIGSLSTETTAIYCNYANALRHVERFEEAEEILRKLVEIEPKGWENWHNLGLLLRYTNRLDEAVAALRRAIALNPGYGPNYGALGHVLHELGRLRSADAAMRRCIDMGWGGDPNLWAVLGNNHRWIGEMDEAQAALEHSLELAPENGASHANLALILMQRGKFDEAVSHYDFALSTAPDLKEWLAYRGWAYLASGQIREGWIGWDHGAADGGPRGSQRRHNVPRWIPDDPGTRVICYREQGIGDEILFASCLPDLIAATPEVVYECEHRLLSLMTRSFPNAEVRPVSWHPVLGETHEDFDRSIPIGSLPMHFRNSIDDFPRDRRSFLVADPDRVEKWRAQLSGLGPGVKVAFSWRSKIRTAERRLEYTRLTDDWEPIFSVPGVEWVSVQYDDCERELRDAERRFGITIHRWEDIDYLNDFEEVSAIMTACDLTIAPRNAVAMLGGALGVPTVTMGNRWDWSDLGTDSSPWFPSVQLVYRNWGDEWSGVIATAAQRVADVAHAPREVIRGGDRRERSEQRELAGATSDREDGIRPSSESRQSMKERW